MTPANTVPATILIVDDEPAIRRFLHVTLHGQGFAVVEAEDGAAGMRMLRHHKPEVVLLDLGLPDGDGMALIEPIRATGDAAILILTSREHEASKVEALDRGADDYVTKPFGVPELLARIRACLRHRIHVQGGRPRVETGDLVVDLVHRRVLRAGDEVHLSPKEWQILEQLAIHAGKVVTHAHLLGKVWGRSSETEAQYLRVYMRQLRQKLEGEPDRPRLLITEPGVGHRLLLEPVSG